MEAFCTLLTSDSYLPGALVLAISLRATGTQHPIVVLVTGDSVSTAAVQILYKYFDKVIFVPTLRSLQTYELELLGRRDLDKTFTKIHCWDPKVMPFDKVVFLDADVLILENIDVLFSYVSDSIDFAAAPDCGWPDCFNSGVFVLKPNQLTFDQLRSHIVNTGSFDGML